MQQKHRLIIFLLVALLFVAIGLIINLSSGDSHEDQTQTVDRNGSVETSLSVEHADSTHDIILTTHKVWVRNSEYATLIHRDTVPALDSMADYQLFITTK